MAKRTVPDKKAADPSVSKKPVEKKVRIAVAAKTVEKKPVENKVKVAASEKVQSAEGWRRAKVKEHTAKKAKPAKE